LKSEDILFDDHFEFEDVLELQSACLATKLLVECYHKRVLEEKVLLHYLGYA
jgi:hypothetical protein